MRGGKRPNAGRKKSINPKVQVTCYFLKSSIDKLGRDKCRSIAEQVVNEESVKTK